MADYSTELLEISSTKDPVIEQDGMAFFGWYRTPEGKEIGVFKDMICEQGGSLTKSKFEDAAKGIGLSEHLDEEGQGVATRFAEAVLTTYDSDKVLELAG